MNVYFISGLAADRSVFKYIRLPEGYDAIYLEWIAPLPGETLPQYAERLAQQMDATKPFGVIGLSFGGMLADTDRGFAALNAALKWRAEGKARR